MKKTLILFIFAVISVSSFAQKNIHTEVDLFDKTKRIFTSWERLYDGHWWINDTGKIEYRFRSTDNQIYFEIKWRSNTERIVSTGDYLKIKMSNDEIIILHSKWTNESVIDGRSKSVKASYSINLNDVKLLENKELRITDVRILAGKYYYNTDEKEPQSRRGPKYYYNDFKIKEKHAKKIAKIYLSFEEALL